MDETYAPIWCQTPTFVKSAYREYLIRFLRKFFIFGACLKASIKSLYYLGCITLASVYNYAGYISAGYIIFLSNVVGMFNLISSRLKTGETEHSKSTQR